MRFVLGFLVAAATVAAACAAEPTPMASAPPAAVRAVTELRHMPGMAALVESGRALRPRRAGRPPLTRATGSAAATWMMIAGSFGLLGNALRRRKPNPLFD